MPTAFLHARELRRNLTPAEKKLWARLRDRRLGGLRFRRQHAIGPFVVDFCCVEKRCTIELDGYTHADQVEYDRSRTQWLNERGWCELRFTNLEVENNLDMVLETILHALQSVEEPHP